MEDKLKRYKKINNDIIGDFLGSGAFGSVYKIESKLYKNK